MKERKHIIFVVAVVIIMSIILNHQLSALEITASIGSNCTVISNISSNDTEAPRIEIIRPANNSSHSFAGYINVTIETNITDNVSVESKWYNIDGGENITFTEDVFGIHFEQSSSTTKKYIIYFFANDSEGNLNKTLINITVIQTESIGGYGPSTNYQENKTEEEIVSEKIQSCSWDSVNDMKICMKDLGKKVWPGNALAGQIILLLFSFSLFTIIYKHNRKKKLKGGKKKRK